jgi:PiT family inorganic phosphate transporter
MIWMLVLAVLLLGYSNGANDNFKGVATLYGSGVLGYRRALALATIATMAGSISSLALGSTLLHSFSGKGLVPDVLAGEPGFLAAVGLGAALTVLMATRIGFPVSTTHALVGALVGAGIARAGSEINLVRLGEIFVLPLLGSPLIASLLASGQYPAFRRIRNLLGVEQSSCACIGMEVLPIPEGVGAATASAAFSAMVAPREECAAHFRGSVFGIDAAALLNHLHILSAAAVSFARGANDTPKIAALLLTAPPLAPGHSVVIAGAAIAMGGLLSARRVAETMSHRITAMNTGQAFTGNLTAAMLVLFASRLGVPVSTTHVTCGALFGIGLVTGRARWGTIGRILLAWLVTLPVAAVSAAAAATLLG